MTQRIAKYEVLEKIAEGGFGTVYKARDPFIKRLVAIKTCSVADQEMARRFFREAEIAGRFDHPNVTIVHDFGVEDQMAYLVQEYLSGEDLLQKIRRRDPISLRQKIDYLVQVAAGLGYAHSQQVIHRDVKPSNLRVLESGQVKILDFGIAKLATATTQLTQKGMAVGTLGYLSPEQLRDQELDTRTDIFSYGVVAYELIAYTRPFQGRQLSALMDEILHRQPVPVSQHAPDCPPALARVVERCLEKDRDRRYRSFDEVIADLEGVRRELGGSQAAAPVEAPGETPPKPPSPPVAGDGAPVTRPIPLPTPAAAPARPPSEAPASAAVTLPPTPPARPPLAPPPPTPPPAAPRAAPAAAPPAAAVALAAEAEPTVTLPPSGVVPLPPHTGEPTLPQLEVQPAAPLLPPLPPPTPQPPPVPFAGPPSPALPLLPPVEAVSRKTELLPELPPEFADERMDPPTTILATGGPATPPLPPPPTVAARPGRSLWPWLAGGAALMAAMLALGIWLLLGYVDQPGPSAVPTPTPPDRPIAPVTPTAATVVVLGAPWGELTGLRGADGRELPLPTRRETPLVLTLPAGHYVATLHHPNAPAEGSCEVDAVVGQASTCRVELLPMDAMQYFKEAGWWR